MHNGQGKTANDLALKAFQDGELRTIVSVQMLNEGVDVPDANMVVFLRNTVSPAIFYQQLGRGTRLADGKEKTVVLDFVANCDRIKMILGLQQEIEGFRTRKPLDEPVTTKAGDEKPNFTLDIATPEFEAKMVDIVELIDRASRGREWTKEEIAVGLRNLYEREGKVTTYLVDLDPRLPHSTTISAMYDNNFNNVLREFGIPINQKDRVYLSKEEMIVEGRAMLARGVDITYKSIDENPLLPGASIVAELFGSCNSFAILCGQKDRRKDFSRDGMLQAYWQESKMDGGWLSFKAIDRNKHLTCAKKYQEMFGSRKNLIAEALVKLGTLFDEEEERQRQEEMFAQAKNRMAQQFYEASVRMGHWLHKDEFKKRNGVSSLLRYHRYFGGGIASIIEYVRELCGDLPEEMLGEQLTQYKTDEVLIKEYWTQSYELRHWLTNEEVHANKKLASNVTYFHRFGGIKRTCELAIELYGDFTKEQQEATN